MSRGGRGGGRGGGSVASRLNSGALSFDIDPELEAAFAKVQSDKDSFFPEYAPSRTRPVTARERENIRHYLDLQDSLRNGWLSKAIEKLHSKKNDNPATFNPFEDVPQYGKKRTVERVPKFSEFPFVKEHFPKELWDVIDPAGESDNPAARKTKKLKVTTKPTRDKLADFDENDEPEEQAEVENEEKNPDDEDFEELQDDEFDEDENDDMADDYNAERYFSGGDEDYDEYAGGDDGGDEGAKTRVARSRKKPDASTAMPALHYGPYQTGAFDGAGARAFWESDGRVRDGTPEPCARLRPSEMYGHSMLDAMEGLEEDGFVANTGGEEPEVVEGVYKDERVDGARI